MAYDASAFLLEVLLRWAASGTPDRLRVPPANTATGRAVLLHSPVLNSNGTLNLKPWPKDLRVAIEQIRGDAEVTHRTETGWFRPPLPVSTVEGSCVVVNRGAACEVTHRWKSQPPETDTEAILYPIEDLYVNVCCMGLAPAVARDLASRCGVRPGHYACVSESVLHSVALLTWGGSTDALLSLHWRKDRVLYKAWFKDDGDIPLTFENLQISRCIASLGRLEKHIFAKGCIDAAYAI